MSILGDTTLLGDLGSSSTPPSAADIPNLDAAKITTGQFVDARMPTASNAATIGAVSTVANAALPKAGGAMTGAITAGSGTYTPTRGWGTDVNGPVMAAAPGESASILVGGAIKAYANGSGFFTVNLNPLGPINVGSGQPLQFAENNVVRLDMRYNSGTGRTYLSSQGSTILALQSGGVGTGAGIIDISSVYVSINKAIILDTISRYSGDLAQTHCGGTANNHQDEATSLGIASISAGNANGTAPRIAVFGVSETNRPGCSSIQSPGKTYASNDTWTNFYNLAEGTHNGQFKIYATGCPGRAKYKINGTSLGLVDDQTGTGAFGTTAGASLVALRISGGWLQINVGSSFTASTKFTATYEGIVS